LHRLAVSYSMIEVKIKGSKTLIPKSLFEKCLIDGKTLDEICSMYACADTGKKCGVYKLDKFILHLKIKHNISLQEYLIKYYNFDWPKCPIKKEITGYNVIGEGVLISQYKRGAGITKEMSLKFAASCEKMSRERKGAGNPMYGKEAWNKGLDVTDERIKKMADARIGLKMDESSKEKMRQRRRESPLKARHTTPHSPEALEKMRINTARLWAEGVFSKTTSIHLKMREFLKTLELIEAPVEEFQEKYYSIDFALPERKIAIECDGDYYHINPAFFPNGPKDAIQRRNQGRDRAKNTFLTNRGWTILRFWECEINSGIFKEKLLCKLKELNLLKESVSEKPLI